MMSNAKAPTKLERRRLSMIPDAGCVVCRSFLGLWMPAEVHHLTLGGRHGQKRRGHAYTVGLCAWHHRGVREEQEDVSWLGPSYALQPRLFRARFGSDADLLKLQSRLLRKEAEADVLVRPYADPVPGGGLK